MILSEQEIDAVAGTVLSRDVARAIEAAIIAKLVKGEVEMPHATRYETLRQECLNHANLHESSPEACHQAIAKCKQMPSITYHLALLADDLFLALRSYGEAREAAGVLRERNTTNEWEIIVKGDVYLVRRLSTSQLEIIFKGPVGINGLTEAEESATASVMGIVNRKPEPQAQAAEPDMRRICEALGFDPTNHHNADKCPYCRGQRQPEQAQEARK